jgi:hypothetical protein
MITSVGVVITSYLLVSKALGGSAYSLMMCGCRNTLRYWISRLTLAFMSGVVILDRLMSLSATW